MADVVERKIGSVTVRIDRLLCVGFADCLADAPELFELDDEGIVAFRDPHGETPHWRVLEACNACPVDALTVLDEEGRQLIP